MNPLAKAMLVPALTEDKIKVALGDEVTTFRESFLMTISILKCDYIVKLNLGKMR